MNLTLNDRDAILKPEARITQIVLGPDPGLGVLHADLKARASLGLDLMEAVRPRIDAYLLRSHTFAARDFLETRQGVYRVLPPLTHRAAETAPAWATAIAPVVASIGRPLFQPDGHLAKRDRVMPTLLTGANRSAGQKKTRCRTT
jgi:hypothetical protein